jgi:hypothetical protein
MAKNTTGNVVGTPGTPPTQLLTYLTAGAKVSSEGAPLRGDRSMCVEQFTGAVIVDALKGLFIPNGAIDKQFRTGMMGQDSAGMDWVTDQNVNAHISGSWAGSTASTLTVDTSANFGITSGWAQTSVVSITAGASISLKKGDIIRFANVFPVNPQNRQIYGNETRTFIVQSDVNISGSGSAAVTVFPGIITAGQFQNVSVTATSSTATVTPYSIGTNGVGISGIRNVLHHKEAYTLATVDLEIPSGVHFASRVSDPKSGISMRVIRDYTINNDQIPCRFDVLFGWAPLLDSLACQVIS